MLRLHEIDLARLVNLPKEKQKEQLRKLYENNFFSHTLNPFRKSIGDITNIQYGLFPSSPETDWYSIRRRINQYCSKRHVKELKYNLAIAKTVKEFISLNNIQCFEKTIMPWNVGYEKSVTYWNNCYFIIDGEPAFIFFDPRLTNPLTKLARKFVFSIMHQRLRVAEPDFQNARLLVAQFEKCGRWSREIKLQSSEETDFYTEVQLNDMISQIYNNWAEVLAEYEHSVVRIAKVGTEKQFAFKL